LFLVLDNIELIFEMTIDFDGFVSKFVSDIDGNIFFGKVKEKKEAKEEYDDAKKNKEIPSRSH